MQIVDTKLEAAIAIFEKNIFAEGKRILDHAIEAAKAAQ
jgi:hypothetical protein